MLLEMVSRDAVNCLTTCEKQTKRTKKMLDWIRAYSYRTIFINVSIKL